MDKKNGFFSKLSDNTKVNIFRWWIQGAIYFFIAWGTNLGNGDPLDLIFVLGLATAVVHILIFNPIIYKVFNIERDGLIINKKVNERTVLEGVLQKLGEFFQSFISVILVFLTYQAINVIAIKLFNYPEGKVLLTGEPILYATFALLYYNLLGFIARKIVALFKKIKDKKNNK